MIDQRLTSTIVNLSKSARFNDVSGATLNLLKQLNSNQEMLFIPDS